MAARGRGHEPSERVWAPEVAATAPTARTSHRSAERKLEMEGCRGKGEHQAAGGCRFPSAWRPHVPSSGPGYRQHAPAGPATLPGHAPRALARVETLSDARGSRGSIRTGSVSDRGTVAARVRSSDKLAGRVVDHHALGTTEVEIIVSLDRRVIDGIPEIL